MATAHQRRQQQQLQMQQVSVSSPHSLSVCVQAISLRPSTLSTPKRALGPLSPTAKRIARMDGHKKAAADARRKAFRETGKCRSLGQFDAATLHQGQQIARQYPPHFSLGAESYIEKQQQQQQSHFGQSPSGTASTTTTIMHGGNCAHLLRAGSQQHGGGRKETAGTGPVSRKKSQLTNGGAGPNGISAQAQQIIHYCVDNARGDLSGRVFSRMVHRRRDFAKFCANLGHELWTQFANQFRQFLINVLSNLQNTDKIRSFSMEFGSKQVDWRSYGFKADFFAEMANSLTTECVFLDGAAHTPSEAIEAWAELVEMMFSAVRDGYYGQVRQLRQRSQRGQQNSRSFGQYNASQAFHHRATSFDHNHHHQQGHSEGAGRQGSID